MPIALAFIAGSCGLVGSEVSPHFSRADFRIAGLDNNQRAVFFGPARDTSWILERLRTAIPGYQHYSVDVRDRDAILRLVAELRPGVIIHTAAQPSHDRAAAIPFDDFDDVVGTLNLLETGIFPIPYHCESSRRVGNTTIPPMPTASPNRSPSTNRSTRFSALREWPLML